MLLGSFSFHLADEVRVGGTCSEAKTVCCMQELCEKLLQSVDADKAATYILQLGWDAAYGQ
jgi:hypothetical protein